MKPVKIRTAFILGAGLGTRLRPLTERCPKPLLPVGGRPLITYAMDHCLSIGVERFIVNTHHCAEAYERAFPGWSHGGAPILFRHEPVLLDTAGGLKNVEDLLDEDEAILVYNGDILSDLPLRTLLAAHATGGREVTLALRSEGPVQNVCLDAEGRICDFRDLLGDPGVRRCLFTGIYMVEKRFLRRLAPGRIESVVPVFVRMIQETPGSVASVVIDEGIWEDVGDAEAYSRICASLPALRYGRGREPGRSKGRDAWGVAAAIPPPMPGEPGGSDAQAVGFVRETLGVAAAEPVEMSPIGKGGSDRDYYRVSAGGRPAVLMRYGRMYAENDGYASVANFLQGIGVTVPAIYGHDPEKRLILMEDLGDGDLYALRDASWGIRRGFYEKTLLLAVRLHGFSPAHLPVGLRLMPGFDAGLYRWERDYFRRECVRNACGVDLAVADDLALEEELDRLAGRLIGTPPTLIHRDLQSQNVMIKNGGPVLIDFQGLRTGTLFYDLGSLLCDPYVSFPAGAREGLLRFYRAASGSPCPWEEFRELFWLAAAQRLMQALGAYGFLGLTRAKRHFLAHIPRALDNLAAAATEAGSLPLLHALACRCREAAGNRFDPAA
ncbi:MAG: phosphotransferase [Deltaproteobacteria bacterium]|nr:phosphotransferase [Deltaproteobacteria bacterium]